MVKRQRNIAARNAGTNRKKKGEKKGQKKKEERSYERYRKNEQPCWTCKHACGGCSWSDELKPVKGWDAVRVKRKSEFGRYTTGYRIISCPEYIRDDD